MRITHRVRRAWTYPTLAAYAWHLPAAPRRLYVVGSPAVAPTARLSRVDRAFWKATPFRRRAWARPILLIVAALALAPLFTAAAHVALAHLAASAMLVGSTYSRAFGFTAALLWAALGSRRLAALIAAFLVIIGLSRPTPRPAGKVPAYGVSVQSPLAQWQLAPQVALVTPAYRCTLSLKPSVMPSPSKTAEEVVAATAAALPITATARLLRTQFEHPCRWAVTWAAAIENAAAHATLTRTLQTVLARLPEQARQGSQAWTEAPLPRLPLSLLAGAALATYPSRPTVLPVTYASQPATSPQPTVSWAPRLASEALGLVQPPLVSPQRRLRRSRRSPSSGSK